MTRIDDVELQAIARDFAERLSRIAPDWTDANDADPGITLLEVFAFLAESLVHRDTRLGERGRTALDRVRMAVDTLAGPDHDVGNVLTRVRYFAGQLLTGDDFRAEQEYVRVRLRRHNRALIGRGVVHGLGVSVDQTQDGQPLVTIEPGCAIAANGEELVVGHRRTCALSATGTSGYVTLEHIERPSGIIALDESHHEASRIEESVAVVFTAGPTTSGIAIARVRRSATGWELDAAFTRLSKNLA